MVLLRSSKNVFFGADFILKFRKAIVSLSYGNGQISIIPDILITIRRYSTFRCRRIRACLNTCRVCGISFVHSGLRHNSQICRHAFAFSFTLIPANAGDVEGSDMIVKSLCSSAARSEKYR